MYSKPAVGPNSKPDESLGRVLDSGRPEPGEIRTRWIPMYSAPAVGCGSKTDEVVVRDLGRATTALQRVLADCAGGIRTHDLRVMSHVLRAGSRSVSKAGRRGFGQTHCSIHLSFTHRNRAGWVIGLEPITDVLQPAVAAAKFKLSKRRPTKNCSDATFYRCSPNRQLAD